MLTEVQRNNAGCARASLSIPFNVGLGSWKKRLNPETSPFEIDIIEK